MSYETNELEEVDPVLVKLAWGQAIRDQRSAMGLTQKQLAEKVGVEQAAVSYWECGAKAPSVERQVAIAAALGVHPRVLFQYPAAAA